MNSKSLKTVNLMYFKTPKNSETGKKIAAVYAKMRQCREEQKALAAKYGFTKWADAFWCVAGGFSAVIFPAEVQLNSKVHAGIWKKVKRNGKSAFGHMPTLNTKKGKIVQEEFEAMPRVSRKEINETVGYVSDGLSVIGAYFAHPDFFVFDLKDNWEYTAPDDCIEILFSEVKKLKEHEQIIE